MSVVHTGISSITVNWTQPSCSDGLPMHYLVQWLPDTVSVEIFVSESNYTITPLDSNTYYDITLLVVDDCGRMAVANLRERTAAGEYVSERQLSVIISVQRLSL